MNSSRENRLSICLVSQQLAPLICIVSLISLHQLDTVFWTFAAIVCCSLCIFTFYFRTLILAYIDAPLSERINSLATKFPEADTEIVSESDLIALTRYCAYQVDHLLDVIHAKDRMLIDSTLGYSTILDIQEEFVIIVDTDSIISFSNRAIRQFMGFKPDKHSNSEIALDELPTKVAAHIRNACKAAVSRANRPQQSITNYDASLDLDSGHFQIEWIVKAIMEDAEPSGYMQFLLVGRDVTEAKILADENTKLEQLAMVGRLSSMISHEISQPLSVITLTVNNLLDLYHEQPSEISDKCQKILRQLKKIEHINQTIRSYHSTSASVATIKPTDLFVIAKQVIAELEAQTLANNIAIRLSRNDVDTVVQSDPLMLEQLLHNVVSNAIDALSASAVVPKLITVQVGTQDHYTSCSIIDNGDGVAEQDMPRLTKPFYTTKPLDRGTGLGLYICSEYAAKMNGSLSINNRDDNSSGLCVTVSLPRR